MKETKLITCQICYPYYNSDSPLIVEFAEVAKTWFVRCERCGVSNLFNAKNFTKEEAIDSWNKYNSWIKKRNKANTGKLCVAE